MHLLPSWRSGLVLLGITSSGCVVHRVGWIDSHTGPTVIVGPDGRRERLVLLGPSAPLKELDGHLLVVDGRKAVGAIQVHGWRALEGPNGYAVWAGPVQRMGVQIGIQDLASGVLVWVDDDAARGMSAHAGQLVAAEGWVDGPQRVQVVAWRPLEE